MPYSGAPRDQLAPGLRVIFHQSHAIYYKAAEAEITIIRVVHGARDTGGLAERGGFDITQ
jgi:toxin ParE1/3/4